MPILTHGDSAFEPQADPQLGGQHYYIIYPWRNVLVMAFITVIMLIGVYAAIYSANSSRPTKYTYPALVICPIGAMCFGYYAVILAVRTFTRIFVHEFGLVRVRLGFETRMFFKDITAFHLVIERTQSRMKIKAVMKDANETVRFKDEKDLDETISSRVHCFGQFLVDRTPSRVKVTGMHGIWRKGAEGPG